MKKNVWIWNHYATNMFKDQAGRHYWFAENLKNEGYNPTIFCASTIHNSDESIDTGDQKYLSKNSGDIPFVFVKTPKYGNDGKKRVLNMLTFYKNLFVVAKEYAEKYGKPDVILASSVHPLTMVAGIKIAKKFGVPCICEVRDLWPESIVAYSSLKSNSFAAKTMYMGEKWIYKKADKLIFTMQGGKDYIIQKGWDKNNEGPIDLKKITTINNGVDLEAFDFNKKNFITSDFDLENKEIFKITYVGSIRKVNNIGKIIEVARIIQKNEYKKITFLIYGDGPEKKELEKYCSENNINNVKFKGRVEKNRIPYILSKSDLNFIHFQQNNIKKYGASLNKLFEYFASGKPIISDCRFGYDLVEEYNAGLVIDNANENLLAEAILKFYNMPSIEYNDYSQNALYAAKEYNFKKLTSNLIEFIEKDMK